MRAIRKVDKERTVSLLSRFYEAPVELIGRAVTLLYHEEDPLTIEVFYNNKSYGMPNFLTYFFLGSIRNVESIYIGK